MVSFVDLLGLEPKIQEPESCVLPITPQVNFLLSDKDSNLERLHQKQLCYHYTIGQIPIRDCKNMNFILNPNIYLKNIPLFIFEFQIVSLLQTVYYDCFLD